MSMTLATAWVRRGVAANLPQKYEVDEAELGRIEKLARLQLEDARQDLDAAQRDTKDNDDADEDSDDDEDDAGAPVTDVGKTGATHGISTEDDDMKEYNLSDYDEDEVDESTGEKFAMFGNVRSLAYHQPGEEDPYLVLPEGADDSDNEREELQILPTDNLILAAKVEDEVPHLEVFVYEDDEDNIYVHHDIMLPSIPLCLEWIDVPVGKDAGTKPTGNYVAVGMMSPEIEVWNLDIVDGMYPAAILGQQPEEKEDTLETTEASSSKKSKKKSKKKKKPKPNDTHHVDAVLTLSLNKHHRNLLASGSADTTIKLWDLNTSTCAKSYTMHAGKVTSLDWHPSPTHSTILLSGSTDDHTIFAIDMRAPTASAPKWLVEADVERVRWNPHDPNYFYVTTEAGTVHYFDSRSPPPANATGLSKPLWTLQAHDGGVSAFDVNPLIPGFLATGSDDKKVKLWNTEDNKPTMVVSRNLEVGRVFSAQFAPDQEVAFRLSVAGSKGQVQVWDTSTNASVRKVFGGRVGVKMPEGEVKERLVGIGGGDDEEEDDESDEAEQQEAGTGEGQDGWESMEED
ncbi:rRNA-processing protein [Neophaeococcomyces mojaviensis]|uniref:rRNA-processing protein n=1 Tax=Neophaeococcomyces mojaviensis TaxID=3383035 RepID=A0ACC3AHU7_9EURO|nr:rRNA-processing protein [Knufia sp. JES_112]